MDLVPAKSVDHERDGAARMLLIDAEGSILAAALGPNGVAPSHATAEMFTHTPGLHDYQDADGVQAHLESCGALLGEFLKIADLTRLELHGPAEELEKLKPALADLNPEYFLCECGIGR